MTSVGTNTGQLSATVHSGASLGPGRFGGGNRSKALSFDGVGTSGSDGQHVSIDGGITMGGGAITACAWVKFKAFGRWSRIIGVGNGIYSDNIYLANRETTNTLEWSARYAT